MSASDKQQEVNPSEEKLLAEDAGEASKVPVWGAKTLVTTHKTIPADARYVSYKCDFIGKNGVQCTHTTGIETRKKADQDLFEHWDIYHKAEYNDMQSAADMERAVIEKNHALALEQEKINRKIEMEDGIFKARARQQIILQKITAGSATQEELKAAGLNSDEIKIRLEEIQKFGTPENAPGGQAISGEVSKVLDNQTEILNTICKAIERNMTSDQSPIGEAVRAIEKLAENTGKSKALLTKEPKCPKMVKGETWEHYWKEFEKYEEDLLQHHPGQSQITL